MTSRAGKVKRGLHGQRQPSPLGQVTTDWMDAIAAPLLLLTPQAKILHSNEALHNLTGYSPQDLRQQFLWKLAIAEQPALQAALEPLAHHQAPNRLDVVWASKTGQPLSITWTFKPLSRGQGDEVLWVATGQISQLPRPTDREPHAAAASPEELAALIESSTDFIALADMDGRLIFINECGRQLVGLDNLQIVQQTTIADYFFESGVEQIQNDVLPTIACNGSWRGELEMRHFQTGAAIPVLFNSTLVRHPQTNEPIGLGTVGRDMTDIRRMEQASQDNEVSFHSLMVGTASVTGQEFFPTFVEQMARALGVSHALVTELVDDRLKTLAFWSQSKLQPNYSYPYLNTPCELSLQEGVYACPVAVQQSFPNDGDLVTLAAESYLGVAMKNRHGETIGNLCLLDTEPLVNVEHMETVLRIFASRAAAELERQRATDALEALNHSVEQALQESQTLLKLVLDTLPLAIFWKDRHCRFLGCNQQMLDDAGLASVADIVGKTDFDLPWHAEAPRYRADDQEVMASGQPKLNIEEPITKAGNVYRWLHTTKMPLRDAAGEIIGVLGIYEDITDHKHMETQLCQSNENLALANQELTRATRLKNEFLANISHELRTPLSSILGMTQALSREVYGSLTERQHRSLNIVERSARHLLDLINNLLDVAKIEAGKIELHPEPISIADLCTESLVYVRQQALQKHIELTVYLDERARTLNGDKLRLRQAVINLLDNAIKFTPEGGQVDLKVALVPGKGDTPGQPFVSISVVDTGIGIAPADQPRLFQTFVQIDSSLNRQYFGTGLGLTMVKHITERHGGTIEVKSKPGQGSCFTLYLPMG
jgi:PAS domain S-box-containing protein